MSTCEAMPSLIPGYEYDIFISYRQKDNKGEHWVTNFVQALKEELNATFKEDISIYFDENPHDGLLETHDVDDSLKDKLKCLIFIPIISQTYCDPQSFAWNHEFLAFKKLASDDSLGLKIKLSSGNVASRVLPVRIHDLDDEDKFTIERELGPLRSIDFIYKEPGVNRSLKPSDSKSDNQNNTDYTNQVNKVANAAKEIIYAIKHPPAMAPSVDSPLQPGSRNRSTKTLRTILVATLAVLGVTAIVFFAYSFIATGFSESRIDRSIAVLPFVDMSPGADQGYLGDGIADNIISTLSGMQGLKVTGRSSSFQYKGEKIDLRKVGQDLGVSNVLEGSVLKSGNRVRVSAQLVNVKDGTNIWTEVYDRALIDIFSVQDEISTIIARKMSLTLVENSNSAPTIPTSNMEAYEYYLKGEQILREGEAAGDASVHYFQKAIELDSGFVDAYYGLANAYFFASDPRYGEAAFNAARFKTEDGREHAVLFNYYFTATWEWEKAQSELKQWEAINPNADLDVGVAYYYAIVYGDNEKARSIITSILSKDPLFPDAMIALGILEIYDRNYAMASDRLEKMIALFPEYSIAYERLGYTYMMEGKYDQAINYYEQADARYKGLASSRIDIIICLALSGRKDEARKRFAEAIKDEAEHGTRIESLNWNRSAFTNKARAALALGDLDDAYAWLERAHDEKEGLLLEIRLDHYYGPYRKDPRFQAMVNKMGFPD